MTRIAVLSEVLINQIAAGEVVERPASVVKELCENAIDAGARHLRVTLEGGGLARIIVSDDGHGMSREDAALCVLRHATSKLRELDELMELVTKGFRGEALPAIAAVSRFTLHTAEPSAAVGTRVTVEGGGAALVEDAPPRTGTLISIEELFFNTPARRKFMKREETEVKHAEEAVIRLALAHPEVAFSLTHDGAALLSSPAAQGDPRERIAEALGREVFEHLVPVEEQRLGVRVSGHIASPEFTLSTARGLYTFVNQRYIRDRGLNGAIQRSFQELLPSGRQPVAVLFIDVDPRSVDVNVHPQKTEVRFSDPRGVSDAVCAALTRTLRAAPWMKEGSVGPSQAPAHYALAVERFLTRAQDAAGGSPLSIPGTQDAPAPLLGPAFGQARPQLNEAPPPGYFGALRILAPLAHRFHLCEGPGGTLVVVDPHAALERLRFTQFLEGLEGGGPPERALFGSTLTLSGPATQALLDAGSALERLGFELEPFGGSTLALKALPQAFVASDVAALLEALAPVLPRERVDAESLTPALRVLACHAARRERALLSDAELRSVLSRLDSAAFHLACTHPRVVVFEMPLLELERRTQG